MSKHQAQQQEAVVTINGTLVEGTFPADRAAAMVERFQALGEDASFVSLPPGRVRPALGLYDVFVTDKAGSEQQVNSEPYTLTDLAVFACGIEDQIAAIRLVPFGS